MQDQLQVERLQHTYVEALHAYVSINHPHVSLPPDPFPHTHFLSRILLPPSMIIPVCLTMPLPSLTFSGKEQQLDLPHPHPPQDRLMFPRMLMKLVSLRTLSSVHSEQVFALRLQDKKLPPLLSEIWDVHE